MSSPSLEEETETNGEGGDPLRLQSREISQKMNTDFFSLAGLDPKSVAAETSSSASRYELVVTNKKCTLLFSANSIVLYALTVFCPCMVLPPKKGKQRLVHPSLAKKARFSGII